MSRVLNLAGFGLLFGVVSAAGLSWAVGGLLLRPSPRALPDPPADLAAEAVELATADARTVAAWWMPEDEARGVIVLAHGKGGSRLAMIERARSLREAGYATLALDLQGHGESPGERITLGLLESEDLRAAVAFVKKRLPGAPVGLIGVSLGGVAALVADPPLEIDALVLESVYATVPQAIGARTDEALGPLGSLAARALLLQIPLRLDASLERLSPTAGLARYRIPMLFLIGDEDHQTPLASVRAMHAAALEGSELVVFERVGHHDLLLADRELWRREVFDYLSAAWD